MRTLSRHYLARYLGLFALTLSLTLLLMLVVETLVNFDDVVDYRDAAGGALAYLFVRVPALYLRDLVPAASFAAAFLSLGLAARSHEILALEAGGVPPQRLAGPILVAALLLSAAALLVNETLLLEATRSFARLQNPGEQVAFQAGSFWYRRDSAFYNVREADADARTLRGVRVFSLGPGGRLLESLEAETVEVEEGGRWMLRDATRRRFDPTAPDAPPRLERFAETAVDAAQPGDLARLQQSESTLSVLELAEALESRRRSGRDDHRIRSMLHARLADPAAVVVFALLAIPLGLGVERTRSLALSALLGIGVVALFEASWYVATLFAQRGFRSAATAPWLVVGVFTGLGALLLGRARR